MSCLYVKWNRFSRWFSRQRLSHYSMLRVSRATPGTKACDAVGGAFRPQRREWPMRKIFRVRSRAGRVTTTISSFIACVDYFRVVTTKPKWPPPAPFGRGDHGERCSQASRTWFSLSGERKSLQSKVSPCERNEARQSSAVSRKGLVCQPAWKAFSLLTCHRPGLAPDGRQKGKLPANNPRASSVSSPCWCRKS